MDSSELLDKEEQEAIEELKLMPKDELDKVPFNLVKWCCQAKGCTNGTKVRDYGISPFFYLQRKSDQCWVNLNLEIWMCGKHNKLRKRLLKSFEEWHVMGKIFDYSIMPIDKIIKL